MYVLFGKGRWVWMCMSYIREWNGTVVPSMAYLARGIIIVIVLYSSTSCLLVIFRAGFCKHVQERVIRIVLFQGQTVDI